LKEACGLKSTRIAIETFTEEIGAVEIAGADHNDLALLDGEKLIAAVVELAQRVCKPLRSRRACGTPRPSPPPA
jgi:hypothetical protein